jgi:NADH-quinone oxidoreductase subunit C
MSDSTGKTTEYSSANLGQPKLAKRTFSKEPIAPLPKVLGSAVPKSVDDVAAALKAKIAPDVVLRIEKDHPGDAYLLVKSDAIAKVIEFLRDDEKFYCSNLLVISAVDYPKPEPGQETTLKASDCIEVVYVLQSYVHKHQIMIKVQLDRNSPKIASISHLYRAANWYERECYDMLGVHFEGHPNLKRILLPQDWVGHPLRKDYVFPEEYNGMKVPL